MKFLMDNLPDYCASSTTKLSFSQWSMRLRVVVVRVVVRVFGIVGLLAILVSGAAPAQADIYSHEAWKELGPQKTISYAELKSALKHITDVRFAKERLAMKYCSDWRSDKVLAGELIAFDKFVLGGLSSKPVTAETNTLAKCEAVLRAKYKTRLAAEDGKSQELKVTESGAYRHPILKIEQTFSFSDIPDQIASSGILWIENGKEFHVDIAAPRWLLNHPAYAAMIDMCVRSVAPIESIEQKWPDRSLPEVKSAVASTPPLDADKILSHFGAHTDDERGITILCPVDAKWSRRYDKIKFISRNATAFEYSTSDYSINLDGSCQYSGETAALYVDELKQRFANKKDWESLSYSVLDEADVSIFGFPGKTIAFRTRTFDGKKPAQVQIYYVGIANAYVYELELIANEEQYKSMRKLGDSIARSMRSEN